MGSDFNTSRTIRVDGRFTGIQRCNPFLDSLPSLFGRRSLKIPLSSLCKVDVTSPRTRLCVHCDSRKLPRSPLHAETKSRFDDDRCAHQDSCLRRRPASGPTSCTTYVSFICAAVLTLTCRIRINPFLDSVYGLSASESVTL